MNFSLLLVFPLIAAVLAFRGYSHDDGQPGCSSADETLNSVWRNNFDPTKYWKCEALNAPGVEHHCLTEFLFQADKKECVKYLEWEWIPLEDPPSRPTKAKLV